jgi:hypothetical protein
MAEETSTLEQPQSTAQEPSSDSLVESTHEASAENNTPPQPKNGQEQQPKKGLSRYERTKRERAAFKAEREAFQRERDAFTKQREESARPKRDYTLKDLTDARAAWENEGRFDLVEAADKEIKAIKAEEQARAAASVRTEQVPVMGTPEHRAEWESAERELAQADPEFMRDGTALDTKLREIMAGPDGNIYRQHPRGIVAAYHRAKMELLSAENSKLKEELKRYRGLTSIGGGAPSRVGTGGRVESVGDFARLSLKDQRKHLLSGADKSGVPWF